MTINIKLDGPFIPFNDNVSSTRGAVLLLNDLINIAKYKDVINLGQGREITEPPVSLFPQNYSGTHSTEYNSGIGGNADIRAAAAAYIKHFLGIEADASNTFVIQQHGRVGLNVLVSVAAKLNASPFAALPRDRWPMYDDIIAEVRGARISEYDNPSNNDLHIDQERVLTSPHCFIDVINSPHNPTGLRYPAKWIEAFADKLNKVNAKASCVKKILTLFDVPYFYALADAQGKPHHFDGGFEHIGVKNSPTPWAFVLSQSKALMANPGLTFIVVHPDLVKPVTTSLTKSVGVSYDPAFFAAVQECLRPDKLEDHKAHYAALRRKYELNRPILQDHFGHRLVNGDPGMTALVEFPHIKGKTVTYNGPNGSKRSVEIDSPERLVEFFANAARVVTVPNGYSVEGHIQARFALAPNKDSFENGVRRISKCLKMLQHK